LDSGNILLFYSIFIIVLSSINIRFRINRGLILTAVSGFHFTLLLFFGLGPLFYAIYGLRFERVSSKLVVAGIDSVYPYFLFGITIISIIEFRNRSKKSYFNLSLMRYLKSNFNLNIFNIFILVISLLAIFLPEGNFAASGVGTIFPVISNFLLPVCILITFNMNFKDRLSVVIFIVLLVTVGYQSFTSAWRSQLIMFFGSILIGLTLRGRVNFYLVGVVSLLIVFIILPFQQTKKLSTQTDFDTNAAFVNSLDVSFGDRLLVTSSFFAERINYAREMGYVQNAISSGTYSLRYGQSYYEIFYQLVPRILWEDKPSYNQFTGREIPRIIGLVSKNDANTSWGVNCFAEYIYNFPYQTLPLYIILLYLSLNYLDSITTKIKLQPQYIWLLQTTLFFLALNLVSVLFSSTYFLWTFLVIVGLNAFTTSDSNKVRVN
jgi:hypothetical protein